MFTEYHSGQAYLLDSVSRAPLAVVTDLLQPRGVAALPDGGAIIAEPGAHRFTCVTAAGQIRARYPTGAIRPWHVARWEDQWLIVDAQARAVYLGQDGDFRELPTPFQLREPRAAVSTGRNSYLLCDSWRHQVVEVTLAGDVRWSYGRLDHPSADPSCLTAPEHAVLHPDGSVIISDTKNHRLLQVGADGRLQRIWGGIGKIGSEPGNLWFPVAAAVDADGRILVADAANGRLQQIQTSAPERTVWGDPPIASCSLQSPRSAEIRPDGYLIADSLNNRVVWMSFDGQVTRSIDRAAGLALFWPRFATQIGDSLFISDSRNERIVEIGPHGEREFVLHDGDRVVPTSDPHSIRPVDDHLLICDTGRNSVFLADRDGQILKCWSAQAVLPGAIVIPVDDLHDAWMDRDGSLWLADTGNGRILCLQPDGTQTVIHELVRRDGSVLAPLHSPRSVQLTSDGDLLICDSGRHRVLLMDRRGTVVGMYGSGRGLAEGFLAHPRFARLDAGRVLIADFGNNRVLDIPVAGLLDPS